MPLDTHAAFRELEKGGFDAKQAEVLVQVINGSMGEQATKTDVEGLRKGLEKLREDVMAAIAKQGEDFKKEFVTKAELKAEIVAATNRNLLGTLAVAALLFTALQLFPLAS